jgi:O-antigen/teichoic acid export membrane protein
VQPCLFLPIPKLSELRGSVRFGGWVTLDRLLWFAYTNVDVAIAGRVLGGTLVGVYTVATSLASIPLEKLMTLVNEISLSAFSRMQGDPERIRSGVLRAVESVSLLAFPTFFGMAMVAPDLVEILLGPKWTVAIVPLQVLCLVFPFRALGIFFAPALFATGQPRVVVENNAITLAGVAVALSIGVQWGVLGLCIGWVAGYVPTFCIVARRTMVSLGIPARQVVGKIGFALTASLTMVVALAGARILVEALPPVPELASMILIGVALYAGMVLAFRPGALRDVWAGGAMKQ